MFSPEDNCNEYRISLSHIYKVDCQTTISYLLYVIINRFPPARLLLGPAGLYLSNYYQHLSHNQPAKIDRIKVINISSLFLCITKLLYYYSRSTIYQKNTKTSSCWFIFKMVPEAGVEPARGLSPAGFKSRASAYSATRQVMSHGQDIV